MNIRRAFQLRTNEHRVQMGHSLHISRRIWIGNSIVLHKEDSSVCYTALCDRMILARNIDNDFCSIANV